MPCKETAILEIVRDIFKTPEKPKRTSAHRKVKGIDGNQIL